MSEVGLHSVPAHRDGRFAASPQCVGMRNGLSHILLLKFGATARHGEESTDLRLWLIEPIGNVVLIQIDSVVGIDLGLERVLSGRNLAHIRGPI